MRLSWLVLVTLALGCNETGLTPDDTGIGPDTDEDTDTDSDTEPPEEICNGADDDGDGDVDEGFPDTDDDGVADCVDEDCSITTAEPASFSDPECVVASTPSVPENPWDTRVRWQYTGDQVQVTPMVGDLDGDGVPEVVITEGTVFFAGRLVVLDGATGAVKWRLDDFDSSSPVALADIDGDGLGEIIAQVHSTWNVVALEHDGTVKWSSTGPGFGQSPPVVTDLEGDGTLEVLVNHHIYEAATGKLRRMLDVSRAPSGHVAAVDMDGDGSDLEILAANSVYSRSGSLLWSCGRPAFAGIHPQPVNVDSDPEIELFVSSPGYITLCDHGGATLFEQPGSRHGTPASIADFDGDGDQEIAVAANGTLRVLDADGKALLTQPIVDDSGLAGTTLWDVDGDGTPEILHGGEVEFLIMDGITGAPRVRDRDHRSITLSETPSVADVDGDGLGDVLYVQSGEKQGVTCITATDDDWPAAPPTYTQGTYYGGNVHSDLSVPVPQPAPWEAEQQIWRGQPSIPADITPAANLRVEITDLCVASCEEDGVVRFAVQVLNEGTADAAPSRLQVWGFPDGSDPVLIVDEDTSVVPGGGSLERAYETTAVDLGAELLAEIDVDDVVDECQEDDNAGTWSPSPCE